LTNKEPLLALKARLSPPGCPVIIIEVKSPEFKQKFSGTALL
jgi:hypothetical protein